MLVEAFVPGLVDRPISLLYGRSRVTNPALSDALHARLDAKPWTAAQLPGGMRLTFLEDAPREAVLSALEHPVEICSVDSYASIVARCRPIDGLRLTLLTPTCPRARWSGNDVDRHKVSLLLPDARSVFGLAVRSWAGPPLPELDWDQVAVSWLEVRTATMELGFLDGRKGATQRGVVGRLEYRCLWMSEDHRCALHALSQFLRYRGVGRKTGMGMGAVATEVTDRRLERRDAGAQPVAVASAAG